MCGNGEQAELRIYYFPSDCGCDSPGDKYKGKTTKADMLGNIAFRLRTNAQEDH